MKRVLIEFLSNHGSGKNVTKISNFTEDWNEFESNDPSYKRITNKSVYNCLNLFNTETGDWYHYSKHNGTKREFEYHTSITPTMVFNEIKEWLI